MWYGDFMNKEELGALITKFRKSQNLTQVDLALKLNVTDRAISNWENGKNYPDIEKIPELSTILNFDFASYIFGDIKKPKETKPKLFTKYSIILLVLLFISSFFLAMFLNKHYSSKIYKISTDRISLGNSYLSKSHNNIVLEIDKIGIDGEIISLILYTNDKNNNKNIIYQNDMENLTLVDDLKNPKYFKENSLKNLNKLYLDISYIKDNNLIKETVKLTLIPIEYTDLSLNMYENDGAKEDKITLLKNNGYTYKYKDFYEKENDNFYLAYDLYENLFYLNKSIENLDYNILYDCNSKIIKGKVYLNNNDDNKVLIMKFNYNIKDSNIICLLGECNNLDKLIELVKTEYAKVS